MKAIDEILKQLAQKDESFIRIGQEWVHVEESTFLVMGPNWTKQKITGLRSVCLDLGLGFQPIKPRPTTFAPDIVITHVEGNVFVVTIHPFSEWKLPEGFRCEGCVLYGVGFWLNQGVSLDFVKPINRFSREFLTFLKLTNNHLSVRSFMEFVGERCHK